MVIGLLMLCSLDGGLWGREIYWFIMIMFWFGLNNRVYSYNLCIFLGV